MTSFMIVIVGYSGHIEILHTYTRTILFCFRQSACFISVHFVYVSMVTSTYWHIANKSHTRSILPHTLTSDSLSGNLQIIV